MRALKKTGFIVISVLLVVIGVVSSGCLRPQFRTCTVRKGIVHFSFEYPGKYRLNKIEHRDTYTDVTLSGPPYIKDMVSTHGYISAVLFGYELDLDQIVNTDIENWETPNTYPDLVNFVLIERSPVTVGGIEGEWVKYSANSLLTTSDISRGLSPVTVITCKVYLVRGKYQWNLSWSFQQTDPETDASFEADFDHIVDTFQILD
jgi:hypothetical protein